MPVQEDSAILYYSFIIFYLFIIIAINFFFDKSMRSFTMIRLQRVGHR